MQYKKLSLWIDPQDVFALLFAKKQNVFWIDSSLITDTNRFSYIGEPSNSHSYFLKNVGNKQQEDIFSYLKKELNLKSIKTNDIPFDFIGGFVGYFGYELKVHTGGKMKHFSDYPDSFWFYVENTIVFDHKKEIIYLVSIKNDEKWSYDVEEKLSKSKKISKENLMHQKISFTFSRTHEQYLYDIETCKEYLARGESYQICLTNNIHTKLTIDPFTLYQTVRKNNPAPFSIFLKHNDLAIICSSPEQFLSIKNNAIETKPIKGTTRRGNDLDEDKELIKELKTNKKEWSENAMIVDLLRNDLGKVCEFGSIKVSKLMDVETYATVHQLVSTVTGKLKKDVSIIDAIKACFPGGSMTGVPKIKTMEIIDSLETEARGIYSGAIGFLSLNNTAKLNIAIRTIVMNGNSVSIGAGGAIVAESNPEKEYNEMILKAQVLMDSISQTAEQSNKIFLSLGSNVGNKKENIENAVKLLSEKISAIKVAIIYESDPMYYEEQDTFKNTVLSGTTNLSPLELLKFVKDIEKEIGRIKRFTNGPREIDIDILFYDNLVYKEKSLQIPHPKIAEREFVLKPFMDLNPNFIHPVLKKTMKELYNNLLSLSSSRRRESR